MTSNILINTSDNWDHIRIGNIYIVHWWTDVSGVKNNILSWNFGNCRNIWFWDGFDCELSIEMRCTFSFKGIDRCLLIDVWVKECVNFSNENKYSFSNKRFYFSIFLWRLRSIKFLLTWSSVNNLWKQLPILSTV